MNRRYQYIRTGIFLFIVLFLTLPVAGHTEEVSATKFNGAMIYSLPFGEKINAVAVKLYPHYMPLRAKHGWTSLIIDLGYRLTNPIVIEEIPGGANRVIGREPFGEKVYIILKGRGYTEIKKKPSGIVKKIYWQKGDAFIAPYGYWVGHANPYDQSARILSVSVALTNDLLNPDLAGQGIERKSPYVLNILPLEQDDSYGDVTEPKPMDWPTRDVLEPLKDMPENHTVYKTMWGTGVNLETLKTLEHHFPQRAERGWTSAYMELGGRILNWFIVQDMPPGSGEIGHKHGRDVFFLGLKGSGVITLRDDLVSPASQIEWGPGDLFCLPPRLNGIWHAHSNPYDTPARLLASVHDLNGLQLLNPFLGQVSKQYKKSAKRKGKGDHVFSEEDMPHEH
ncbi:cupin domain-containing protein [Thermodesulfobacteriota bacterium]